MTAGRTVSIAASPAPPPEAATTENPSSSSPLWTLRRIPASSSTSRTVGSEASATLDLLAVLCDVVLYVRDDAVLPVATHDRVDEAIARRDDVVAGTPQQRVLAWTA